MTKQQAGRLGGMATFAKYGAEHMREIGKQGAVAFWKKYTMKPYGTYQWAIINRRTNVIIGYTDWRSQ